MRGHRGSRVRSARPVGQTAPWPGDRHHTSSTAAGPALRVALRRVRLTGRTAAVAADVSEKQLAYWVGLMKDQDMLKTPIEAAKLLVN